MTAGSAGAAVGPPAPRTRIRPGRSGERPAPPTADRIRRRVVALAAVLLLVLAGVLVVFRGTLLPGRFGTAMPTSAAMESTWGVRFTQVGMSADGGMVDVRYLVLDVDKAAALAASIPNTPVLVEESSDRTIFAVAMKAHAHDLHPGGRYYLLYRNTDGLIEPGKHLTIRVGDQTLAHVPVSGVRRP